ncbi:MAG: MFS transporter [Candidatus Heimdallarchaeota archaeon]|nr:MAG: MFS transporter [Candidatus Heimdallarchaeota archaeon]
MEEYVPDKPRLPKIVVIQSVIIGILFAGENIFGFFEQNFMNTYLSHVLWEPAISVSIMVSLSAAVGLIMNLTFGILSDNSRTRFGRRKPFFLIGGLFSGIFMILFAFSQNFLVAVVIDAFLIGMFSNAYYVSERALIPDIVEPEYRGRANGIISIIGYMGLLLAIAGFLVANEIFAIENPKDPSGTIITKEGHLFVMMIGGLAIIICSIIGFFLAKEPSLDNLPPKKGFIEELSNIFNFLELKKQKEFFKITLAYTIFQSGIAAIMPFLFIFIFSLGLSTLELVFTVLISFPIMFIVTYFLGRFSDQYGRKKFVPIAIFIVAIGISLVLFVKSGDDVNLPLLYLCFPFIIVGLLGLATPLQAWSQDLLPDEKRGTFYGLLNFIYTISQIVGATAAGLVASATALGIAWIFPLGSLFFILSIPFFLRVKETLLVKESVSTD